jgi:hypothetical protein
MAKLTITRTGSAITATDGTRERCAVCAGPHAADILEERLKKDRTFAAKWLKSTSPVQLHLPLGDAT